MSGTIYTRRLALVPLGLDLVRAAIADRAGLARLLSARIPDEWPGPDLAEILPFIARSLEEDPLRSEWSRLIMHAADRTLIGDIGFKAPPDGEGTVEIGYSVIAPYRGQGVATEAGRAVIDWAFTRPGVRRITAECFDANLPSMRVLHKLGMRRLERDGRLLKWELPRAAPVEETGGGR